jgi:hypothetical protein
MRGTVILLVFFSLFTSASLLIPSPMFPGSVLCTWVGAGKSEYAGYLGAILNGIFYGAILWLVFVMISKRIVAEK